VWMPPTVPRWLPRIPSDFVAIRKLPCGGMHFSNQALLFAECALAPMLRPEMLLRLYLLSGQAGQNLRRARCRERSLICRLRRSASSGQCRGI
jgi:hypothetical protein